VNDAATQAKGFNRINRNLPDLLIDFHRQTVASNSCRRHADIDAAAFLVHFPVHFSAEVFIGDVAAVTESDRITRQVIEGFGRLMDSVALIHQCQAGGLALDQFECKRATDATRSPSDYRNCAFNVPASSRMVSDLD